MRIVGFALLALACLAVPPARACLQGYEKGGKGPEFPDDAPLPAIVVKPMKFWQDALALHGRVCDAEGTLEACNNKAVALVRLGRPAEAIPLLESVEKKSPGAYQTAVNLGTALELTGQDEAALKWITEGMRRNAQSHGGTEWLHARILEAKLALKKDAQWLGTHSPLDGEPHGATGSAGAPAWRASGVKLPSGASIPRAEVARALWYQLNERMQFVKPPEPIVGELLLELASLVAIDETADKAMRLLKQAEEFRPVRLELLAARKKHFEGLLASGDRPRARAAADPALSRLAPYAIAMLVVLASLGVYLWRWRRRNR